VRGSTLLFCLVYSVVFLRERPSPRALVGVLLAIGAVLLVSFGG
jgi:drug/metabolite transporter (DMT)-like permease